MISLLIHFIIWGSVFPSLLYSLSLARQPRSSTPTAAIIHPLISSIFHFSGAEKKDTALTIGQNVAHSHCLAYSISLSILLYSLVHLQCRTMPRRPTGWRLLTGLVTWWHTKATLSKIPLRCGTCVTVQPCLQPFLWSRVSLWRSRPPAITIKLPSAVGTRVFLSVSELIPHRSFSFVRYADRVSLLTPLCFTLATGTKVPLFSEEMCWKYDSPLFPMRCPLSPRPPD